MRMSAVIASSKSTAECVAVDRGDDRLAQPCPLVEHLVAAAHPAPPHVERLQGGPLVDVRTDAEGLLAFTRER